ncbi:MAG: hypothetical protein HC915_16705, partial [Anaerolineae bacterium]|nr:hypothetical protein [Anaerolineae bacterium]
MLLGANRVGFATMAMVAIGCTICRKCHEGTCHVGITTHITTVEEAQDKGLKSFVPREYDPSVDGMVRIFQTLGQEMQQIVAALGFRRAQDLVGRADLLEQVECHALVDLAPLLEPAQPRDFLAHETGVGRRLTRPRNNLTTLLTGLVAEAIEDGEREVTYADHVMAQDRALGAHLAGELVRRPDLYGMVDTVHLHFGPSSIGGNGFAAFTTAKMDVLVEGGAQDGTAKSISGGQVAVMKGLNHKGLRVDGSVARALLMGNRGRADCAGQRRLPCLHSPLWRGCDFRWRDYPAD